MNKIIDNIKNIQEPYIIAISGFGGSGKSTLANKLSKELNIPVISIDSFWKDQNHNYSNWEIIDLQRFENEVLVPFKNNLKEIEYENFSWDKEKVPSKTKIANTGKLIVEGVGIFRPEILKYFDYKIWVDVDLNIATTRGKKRDLEHREFRSDELWDSYWDNVWKRNDEEFFKNFNPKDSADIVYNNN